MARARRVVVVVVLVAGVCCQSLSQDVFDDKPPLPAFKQLSTFLCAQVSKQLHCTRAVTIYIEQARRHELSHSIPQCVVLVSAALLQLAAPGARSRTLARVFQSHGFVVFLFGPVDESQVR